MVAIRSEMVSRLIGDRRGMAERLAGEMLEGMLSDIDFLEMVYRPVAASLTSRESFVDEGDVDLAPGRKDRTHRNEQYQEGISELFYKLLDRSFRPKGGEDAKQEALATYMGRQDIEDAIQGAYKLFKSRMGDDITKKIGQRIKSSYSPFEYKLYKVIEKENKAGGKSGRWEAVDSYMGSATNKDTIEESKKKFIDKFKKDGIDTSSMERDFDQGYMIKAERKNLLDDLGMNLNPGKAPELVDDMITRMMMYYIKNPDAFDEVLVRAVLPPPSKVKTKDQPVKPTNLSVDDRKKDDRAYRGDDEDMGESDGTTLGLAWFRPLPSGKDAEESELRGLTRRRTNIDSDVKRYLEGAGSQGLSVPWKFEGVHTISGKDPTVKWDYESESMDPTPVLVMDFKLPEYSESRVFSMAVPGNLSPAVRDQRAGESSTMSYKGYSPDKGILVQFNEMADQKKKQVLETLYEDGVPAGKMGKVVTVMSDHYFDHMAEGSKAGLAEILGDLRGIVTIGGSKIDSPEEMEDVIESYIADRNQNPRDTDLISDMIEGKDIQESRDRSVTEDVGEDVSQVLAKGDEISRKIEDISDSISRELPVHAEFGNIKEIGLARAFLTYPTMKWIIRSMLDDTLLKAGQSGKIPWMEFTGQLIKSEVFKDPAMMKRYMGAADISAFFTAMSIVMAKDQGLPADEVMKMVEAYKAGTYKAEPKDYPSIVQYIRSSYKNIGDILIDIKKEIQRVLLDMYRRGDPVVRKIFRTAPGFEGKIKGVSEGMRVKQQESQQKSRELEEALLKRDFEKANEILKSVSIKAGTPLNKLMKAKYAPGGADMDDAASSILNGLLDSFEAKSDALIEEAYHKSVRKVLPKEDTKEAAMKLYHMVLSGEVEASVGYSSEVMEMMMGRIIRRCMSV